MRLNRFKLRIIIQSFLIAAAGYFAVHSFISDHLWITRISLVLIWFGLLINIINYTSRTNRRLESFLSSLNYLDLLPEKDDGDNSFRELNLSLNQIISTLKDAKKDKEAQSVYLRNTVEHISTGLISFDDEGKIKMYNKAARQLLQIHVFSRLENLDSLKKNLDKQITVLQPGENLLSAFVINGELQRVIFRKAEMVVMGEKLNMVSLQDIRVELEEEELETWQKLISVLRHEIMNSAAPLTSLTLSLRKIIRKVQKDIPENEAGMLLEGLEAISRRTEGMMNFVRAYKTLTSLPKPNFTEFPVLEVMNESIVLFNQEIKERKIHVDVDCSEKLVLTADYDLISQVLINLLKNALEAVSDDNGGILIIGNRDENGSIRISVEDNGTGIPPDQLENIYIPFFTTKEDGSGIGLSLSRQIMRIHKGKIQVSSEENKGTRFTLIF